MKRRIIIIDDNKRNEKLMTNLLTASGYDVETSASIQDSYGKIIVNCPDIIILDPLYPKKDGLKLIHALREWTNCPIIAVSQDNSESAVVDVFNSGADDFLRKPFYPGELLARVRSMIRHIELYDTAKGISTNPYYYYENLLVDYDSHSVKIKDKEIHLTKNEFKILMLLCRYSGKVLTYDFIMKHIWGPQATESTGILRVNMTNLRKKIEEDVSKPKYLFTQNGVGYKMSQNQAK